MNKISDIIMSAGDALEHWNDSIKAKIEIPDEPRTVSLIVTICLVVFVVGAFWYQASFGEVLR